MLLLPLVSRAEETMTLFVPSFKHLHGPLPAGPHQWPAQAETGKVRRIYPDLLCPINQSLTWQSFVLISGPEKNGQSRVRQHPPLTKQRFRTALKGLGC
jgi:hypothetical protein